MRSFKTKKPKGADSEMELHNTLALHELHRATEASEVCEGSYSGSKVSIQRWSCVIH